MHPMKRPRRPVKRKVALKKIVKRKIAKRAVKFSPATKRAIEEVEASIFDIPKPPHGFAYQWAPFSRVIYMASKGWSQVPFSRHQDMPKATNFDGYVVYRDTALFQISEALAKEQIDLLAEQAKDLTRDFDARLRREEGGRGFYILPSSFMVDSAYDRVPDSSPPVEVTLTIKLRVPARWCDTANALQLAHPEYARRRISQTGYLISPDHEGVFSPFELTTKKVEI
jgi:hypothetical protein